MPPLTSIMPAPAAIIPDQLGDPLGIVRRILEIEHPRTEGLDLVAEHRSEPVLDPPVEDLIAGDDDAHIPHPVGKDGDHRVRSGGDLLTYLTTFL